MYTFSRALSYWIAQAIKFCKNFLSRQRSGSNPAEGGPSSKSSVRSGDQVGYTQLVDGTGEYGLQPEIGAVRGLARLPQYET